MPKKLMLGRRRLPRKREDTDSRPHGGGLVGAKETDARAAYAALGREKTLILGRTAAASAKPKTLMLGRRTPPSEDRRQSVGRCATLPPYSLRRPLASLGRQEAVGRSLRYPPSL